MTPEHVLIVILYKLPNAITYNHLKVVMLC